jgi:hypothetical protein
VQSEGAQAYAKRRDARLALGTSTGREDLEQARAGDIASTLQIMTQLGDPLGRRGILFAIAQARPE